MPSLRIAKGLFTPCNLKYKPHALHTGSPSLLRRQRVVVRVPQLVQHKPKRRVAVYIKLKKKKGEKKDFQLTEYSNRNFMAHSLHSPIACLV